MKGDTFDQEKTNESQNKILMTGFGYHNRTVTDDPPNAICPQCGEDMISAVKLKEHMTQRHFSREIKERYVLPNSRLCTIDGCGKEFPHSSSGLIRHIGSTHSKVLEIMEEKGIKIPAIFSAKVRSMNKYKLYDLYQ